MSVIIQMFGNAYQNGPYLEVWDARVDPSKNNFYQQLATTNSTQPRSFDKEAKSYLHNLQSSNSRINLPASDNKTLSLHQQYLVLHIFIPIGFHWWIELAISDITGVRRRINLTTVPGKQEAKYFSYRYPIEVSRGSWLFLGIDLYSFMEAFKGQTFRALDHITVGSHCRLRRIFTMKQFVEYQIPKNYWLAPELPQSLQIICFQEQRREGPSFDLMSSSIVSKNLDSKQKAYINRDIADSLSKAQKVSRTRNQSQVIVEKAKKRLHSLEKQQELLLKQSLDLQQSQPPIFQINTKRQRQILNYQEPINQRSSVHSKDNSLEQKGRSPKVKAKLPLIQKSFKEDEALNMGAESWIRQRRQQTFVSGGGLGMFPSTVITRQNDRQIRGEGSRKQLQLIYDQMVGCYYHPETNSYYQLRR